MTFRVAIPSYHRAKTVIEKTIPLLTSRGIGEDQIDVFVSDFDEVHEYIRALAGTNVQLHKGELTTRANRSVIHRHYPKGTNVVSIDDDISDVIERITDKQARPVKNLAALFDDAFRAARGQRVNLWGVYPVANPYFMSGKITTDLRFIVGCLYGFIADPEADQFHTELDEKEDYERTIKCFDADNGVLRLNFIAPVTRYYKEPGGMQEYRTEAASIAAAEWLLKKYPHYVSPKNGSKTGYREVMLKNRRK